MRRTLFLSSMVIFLAEAVVSVQLSEGKSNAATKAHYYKHRDLISQYNNVTELLDDLHEKVCKAGSADNHKMAICQYEEGYAAMYEDDAEMNLNSDYYDGSGKGSSFGESEAEINMRLVSEDLKENSDLLKENIPLLCGAEGKEKTITLDKAWQDKWCNNAKLATNEPGSVNSIVDSLDMADDSDDLADDLYDIWNDVFEI